MSRPSQLGQWELAESSISPLLSIMSAYAAHVVHYGPTPACAGAKNWFINEFVLAICSIFLGLPGPLPVLTNVTAGLVDTRIASLHAIRFYIYTVKYAYSAMPCSLSSLSQSRMCWSFNLFAYLRMSWQPGRASHFSICSSVKRHLCY